MKSRIQSILLACFALTGAFLASCSDDTFTELSAQHSDQPFTLTVTQAAPTRLELDEDGLTTQWEPGDKLVLVDKSRTIAPIYLTTTLEEKASSASFVSESGVPAGSYYVIYNYNENMVYSHQTFSSIDNINSNDKMALWGELNITEGTYSASISLQHVYAKVRVVLENVPTGWISNLIIGMYSSKKGFPFYRQLASNGWADVEYGIDYSSLNSNQYATYFSSNRKFHNIQLGCYDYSGEYNMETGEYSYDFSQGENLSALILPADLTGEDVYFYVFIEGGECYEIKKSNINFKAGTSYKVVLDLSKATVSTLGLASNGHYQISSPAEWRYAAYKCSSDVMITQNIDFSGDVFFPLDAYSVQGGGYTLSNINLDWSDEDNVGLIQCAYGDMMVSPIRPEHSMSKVSDLTLENVTFKGNNFVGALGGYNIAASNCKVIGSSTIAGKGNYVGGIAGCNTLNDTDYGGRITIDDVRIGQSCVITGKNYVGGVVGRFMNYNVYSTDISVSSSMMLLESCTSEATVTATEDYVGGIFGKVGGSFNGGTSNVSFSMDDYTYSLVKCVNKGTVSGRNYVGGIGGDFSINPVSVDRVVLKQSYSEGNVSGSKFVGGITGSTTASINTCYSIGTISATTSFLGGISGMLNIVSMGNDLRIANCYSLASLSVGENGVAGGIVGTASFATIKNCYFAGENATTCGIVGSSGGACSVSNCLTTLSSLGTNLGEHVFENNYDYDGDGTPDYTETYNYDDSVGSSTTMVSVTSILDNKDIINGDNSYSDNYWDLEKYPWYCVKFADFSVDTDSPDYNDETIN